MTWAFLFTWVPGTLIITLCICFGVARWAEAQGKAEEAELKQLLAQRRKALQPASPEAAVPTAPVPVQ